MAIRHRGTIGIPMDGFSTLVNYVLTLAVFGAAGYGVYWLIGETKRKADSEVAKSSPDALNTAKRVPRADDGKRPATAPIFPGYEPKPGLDRAAAEVNILILAKEAAKRKGDSVTEMEHAMAVARARARFNALAQKESNVPEVLWVNEEILGLDDKDFSKLSPEAASRYISQAITTVPPGSWLKVRVRRPQGERDVKLYFIAESGTGLVVAQPGYVKISNPLAIEIQQKVLSLPSDQLTETERKQIEKILGLGEATDEEYGMILRRLNSALVDSGTSNAQRDSFARQITRLRNMLEKAPVPEAVVTKDGRRFAGKLLQDTPQTVAVRTAVGDITIAKDDVSHLVTSADLRAEFDSKFKAGASYKDAYGALLTWTREMNMPVHRELVAYTILQDQPMDPFARNAAGYIQADGAWVLKNSIAAGAPIPVAKAETRDEMRRELEAMGYILRGNNWFTKISWSTGIQTLHKPSSDVKLTMSGATVQMAYEGDTPKSRLFNPTGKPKGGGEPTLRFIAPTGVQGMATIAVEAPGEILECSVKAAGTMFEDGPKEGRVECFITADGGKSEYLYNATGGSDLNFHDVTLLVRGKKKFTVTARMTTLQDKFHTYARFLQSLPATTEVFWVKGVVLKAAPEFDRAWSAAK